MNELAQKGYQQYAKWLVKHPKKAKRKRNKIAKNVRNILRKHFEGEE